ncbi:MAG: DUF6088 family protein [Chitinophagaceae bacterium]
MSTEKSLHSRLEEEIARKEPGMILFPADFLEMGNPEAIHMSFSRLADQQIVIRLGKGIYTKPKTDPMLGPILPSLDDIAQAIAKKEKVIIRPTGAYALNKLGLSTQVPTKVVFLTNGSRRRIQIGRGTITFKPTTPKNLAAENEIVFLAIQSLIELGERGVNDKVKMVLTEKLRQVPQGKIREDARYAPQFASKILLDIANKLAHNG